MNDIDRKHYFALAATDPAKEDISLMRIMRLLVNNVSKQSWGHVKSLLFVESLSYLVLWKIWANLLFLSFARILATVHELLIYWKL